MDSSHVNNTGSANFISDYNQLTGPTPASEIDDRMRTTIYGSPVLVYYKETPNDTAQHFIGVYNLNLDKSCTGSFGFEDELEDEDDVKYDFRKIRFIDDEATKDVLDRSTLTGEGLEDSGTLTKILLNIGGEQKMVDAQIWKSIETGETKAAFYDGVFYEAIDDNRSQDAVYVVLKEPSDNIKSALLDSKGYIYTIDKQSCGAVQCFEFKANSGASGAGGFGNYALNSVSNDLECRYPDDGDLEDENYAAYETAVGSDNAIDFTHWRSPYYYNIRRMIRWVSSASKDEFLKNVDRYFNRTYLMDYYLTIMLLGGVDSLGKNLMVASWGPENHLYETSAAAIDKLSDEYDERAFKYMIGDREAYLTPKKIKLSGAYVYAENEKGQMLYYKEQAYNRYTKELTEGYAWDENIITTTPGEDIQYPIFYDIDTINGLDNSGQLLYDVDIEIGDQLADGTAVFNTADSNLWRRVRDYLGDRGDLAERWNYLRSNGKFTVDNLVGKFYYERQISKIPETYYNQDCFLKYIYEGPNPQQGSGTYLYCIHGSRYEHIKRWFTQRIFYIDTMFGALGSKNSSLRFNHGGFDANFAQTKEYYSSYPLLVAKYPDLYALEDGKLIDAKTTSSNPREIIPINFNIKTYQPSYVGVKWANTGSILYYRVARDETVNIVGNVPSSGDSEVFIFGDVNIKELGDLAPYNVKQVDFRNLTKLSKLLLGSSEYTVAINKLDLGTNSYLAELKLNGCTSLSTVDVSSCTNLREIDMTDSGITSITLPVGGALKSISYSAAITAIDLRNFISLETVVAPSLNNLKQLVIKNCPKILGSKDSRTSKAWSILQNTYSTPKLDTIELTSYGVVDPIIRGNEEFFFANKYWEYGTASKIAGEVYYTGNTIPSNFSKFAEAYPKLDIYYQNITDASEMFANYKNINCISSIEAYAGKDNQGNDKRETAYYWTDETPELREKWHNEEMYNKYGYSSEYNKKTNNKYYYDNTSARYYRLLELNDKEDLDMLRSEIRTNLQAFKGTKFDNVSGMFRNVAILDYLFDDTFNSIDLSAANTTEMFSGCSNLRYFTLPGDSVINEPIYIYYNELGEIVDENEWDSETGTFEHKTNENGEKLYKNIFMKDELTEKVSVYPKGIRKIGSNMFYNCKKARILIKKLSNSNKIEISADAFKYDAYNPSLQTQPSTLTSERPAIFFEHTDIELLKTSAEEKPGYIYADENLYFVVDGNERVINMENKFITFRSNTWLREVYFNAKEFIINDTESDPGFNISYIKTNNNENILIDVERIDKNVVSFNKGNEYTITNKLNLISITQGAFVKIADAVEDYEIPFPRYDCFDTSIPKQDYERSLLNIFSSENYCLLGTGELDITPFLPVMKKLFITGTNVIHKNALYNFKNLEYVGFDLGVEEIGESAFQGCSNLIRLTRERYTENPDYFEKTNIIKIGESAFANSGLTGELYLPSKLVELGNNVLSECSKLTFIKYSSLLTTVPKNLCYNNTSLQYFTNVSEDLMRFEDNCFNGCKLLNFINSSTSEAVDWDFRKFKNLEYIGSNAFNKCNIITSGSPTEEEPELTKRKMVFHDKIKEIGDRAFAQDITNDSAINVEFIWDGTDFSELNIGSNAFMYIRTSWTPEGYDKPLEDTIYIPDVLCIGNDAFRPRSSTAAFKLALCKDSEKIGNKFIRNCNKIVFNYKGMEKIDRTTYIFIESSEKYALVYNVDATLTEYNPPISVNYRDEPYFVKELLSNCLELSNETLTSLIFKYGTKLDTIETNVLSSQRLTNIIKYMSESDTVGLVGLPEGIKIASGNNLKNTQWFSTLEKEGFITLGEYILGYKPLTDADGNEQPITELDFNDPDVAECNIIYDNAFMGIETLTEINLIKPTPKEGERDFRITNIYKEAFNNCININQITLPETLETIGDYSFIGAPITELFIPKSVKECGSEAFGTMSGAGKIRKLIIEDGSVLNSLPIKITTEIRVNNRDERNITLNYLHIPGTTGPEVVNNAAIKILSQVRHLTVGNLRVAEDGTYLIDNYPIWLHTDENGITSKVINKVSESDVHAVNDDGELLYCPAFYRDIMKGFAADAFVETTESKSYYPQGDIYNEDGELLTSGYDRNLDITGILAYNDYEVLEGIDISGITTSELTNVDMLRIAAGFSTYNGYKTLRLNNSAYKKLSSAERRALSSFVVVDIVQNK